MTVLAWHNDPELKAAAVARMRAHRDADDFIQGIYLEFAPDKAAGFRGCFHGCLTGEVLASECGEHIREFANPYAVDWHGEGERLWGIPADVGAVLDKTFENIDAEDAGRWAVAVTEAIPVGADLSGVPATLIADLLARHGDTVTDEAALAVIRRMEELWRRAAAGDQPTREEWVDAADAALGVDSVAYQGAGDTWPNPDVYDALGEAVYAAAELTARWWRWVADRLLELLAAAPLPGVDGWS